MTTAAPTSVDWVRFQFGDRRIDLRPPAGIQLRLIVEPERDEQGFGLLDSPLLPRLQVAVDLIPVKVDYDTVARCEWEAGRIAAELGAYDPPLALLREFSLEAGLSGDGLPYDRVSIPRLTLLPSGPPELDEDQPLPGVRIFTATVHASDGGSQYVLTRQA